MKRTLFTLFALFAVAGQETWADDHRLAANAPAAKTPAETFLYGDVNNDGKLTIADVTATVNVMLGNDSTQPYIYNHKAADLTGDGQVNTDDVAYLVDILLGKALPPTTGNTDDDPATGPAFAPKKDN